MTVERKEVIDWLGIEKGTSHILLTLVDDLDWSDEHGHLLALQEKLNTYLAFIESGEVFERLAEEVGRTVARDTPVKVSILAKHPLPEHAKGFFEYAKRNFGAAGFGLSFKVVAE
jgi:hypothetical protein